MRAVDENGIGFEVFQCGVDCVRDIYWNVYLLKTRTGEEETYAGVPEQDIITVERCDCEGSKDPAPGASIFNGENVERCDECKRFAYDEDAVSAYAAGLNRAVGHQHFTPYYGGRRQYIALLSAPHKWLSEEEIDAELKRLNVTITSPPFIPNDKTGS